MKVEDITVGMMIYRAACMEEVRLEPGRIQVSEVTRIDIIRDVAVLTRIFDGNVRTKPQKMRASWLVMHGWRATPELAADAGVIYLRRQVSDHETGLETARTALAALEPKATK